MSLHPTNAGEKARGIRFTANAVIKSGSPALMRIEAEKMRRAHELAASSGLFLVPEVVDLDEKSGRLTMARIPNICGIRNARIDQLAWNGLMKRLGAAISLVHDELRLPDEMRVSLPRELGLEGGEVFLHGDLSSENVCVTREESPKIVLIDWQMSPRFGGEATWGTPYFDLAWFVGNLFRKPCYKYISGVNVETAAGAFIESYFVASRRDVSVEDFDEYHEKFRRYRMLTQEQNLFWPKRILLAHGFGRWCEFTLARLGRGGHV